LTKDEIALCHHVNVSGNQCPQVLQLAHINAVCQSGKKNSIDTAILNCMNTEEKQFNMSHKVYELPFNFESRRSSCIVRMPSGKLRLICKGALEEVLSLSSYIRMNNESLELDDQLRQNLLRTATAFNYDGYRVVLVATREIVDNELSRESFDGLDSDLIIEGLLAFLDPPKDDAKASVARLQALGIDVKILTGDSIGVAMKVCQSLELIKEFDDENIQAVTGPTLAQLEGDEFHRVVKHCKVFAKLTPSQKGDVINSLKEQGEVVGMLGDGINDCVALRNADAGISVDTGTSVAKECAGTYKYTSHLQNFGCLESLLFCSNLCLEDIPSKDFRAKLLPPASLPVNVLTEDYRRHLNSKKALHHRRICRYRTCDSRQYVS
jgi:Mg2+-importing ATPase